MSENRLLSVAEIARQLDVPESTLHYWKNRFAQYLPSFGRGRLKRFRPEAVEAFALISGMLKSGRSSEEVMAALAGKFPLNAQTVEPCPVQPASSPLSEQPLEPALRLAAALGLEMARSLGEGLKSALSGLGAAPQQTLDTGAVDMLTEGLSEAADRLSSHAGELETLRSENQDLRGKLSVLEAELIRLRKDRREMEKFLLDKIKGVTT